MRITCLAENTASSPRFSCEHGLSLFIETAHRRILFDFGQSALFTATAAALHIDLASADTAVLSHGHYDHGGGLAHFLTLNPSAPVYVRRDAFEPHYHGPAKYIGLAPSLAAHPSLRFTDRDTPLGDGITLLCGDFPRDLPAPDPAGFLTLRNGAYLPDDFLHEQYLLLEEDGRRVLITGCSHRGIAAIVSRHRPDVLIGGFHFSKRPADAALTADAVSLAAYDTDYYTCHCTGTEQYECMKQTMSRLHYLSTGQTIGV